ncbi:nucleoporin GLE1-like [Patiria miniata]|uniref:mRNA export factor GLE1 n=1 Tax=Patiria miniata TaxID=46514 RepID=A0A913ZSP9_PATMI|nr:nucleoporin GLE1-like [Patiria miniata]XP_038054789.1 nucleoporin GLE1-like [Patiria miniata]
MSTSKALQLSKKGGLVYDSGWYRDGLVHETIVNCTSPPKIPATLSLSVLHKLSHTSDTNDTWSPAGISSFVSEEGNLPSDASTSSLPREEVILSEIKLDDIQATLASVQTGKSEVSIQECKQQWDKLSKERTDKHRHEIKEHSDHLQVQAVRSSCLLTEQQDEKTRLLLQNMQHVRHENDQMRKQRLQHQRDRYNLHVKRMEMKLKNAYQKEAEAEIEAEHNRRVAERQTYLDSMMNVHKQIDESSKKICLQLNKFKHKEFLHPDAEQIKKSVEQLAQKAEHLLADAKQKGASMDLVESMHKIIESLMIRQEHASNMVAEAERLAQDDMARKVREAQHQAAAAAAAAAAATQTTTKPRAAQLPLASLQNNDNSVLHKAISADTLKEYEALQNKHNAVMDCCQKLATTTDTQLKKYRFDLQKAVNIPVNAISNQSGTHLMDKLQRLKSLLLGEMVNISGRRVSVTRDEASKAFVKNLLAKKIVKQSDEQVSSNYESAFPFAAIAVTLWCDFPDLGDLMLAHFYLKCPFLVPYHITKSQEQSNQDYYKSLGYNYESDGTIEKQDKYLRRMSGFMRLYAAIMITQPMPNARKVHPYGIDHAWKWLARLLNVEPQPDITATMLFDFLEVCGHDLAASYHRQFFKLLQVLYRNYFPKIESVTPKGSGGPVMRLKTFLEMVTKTQRIAPPKGTLQADFWRT